MGIRGLPLLTGLLALTFFAMPAVALQYITGHITQLEPTYMPDKIALQMDVGNTACPAGKWLWWVNGAAAATGAQDSQSVYATMLAALLSRKSVDFVIDDGDTTCNGKFFHLHAD